MNELLRGGGGGGGGTVGTSCGVGAAAKRKQLDELDIKPTDVKKAKLETKALKAKRPGFTDERYNETSYYQEPENGKSLWKLALV